MHKKQWLKIVGIIELLLASVIGFIFLLALLSPMRPNNHPDGSYELAMIAMFLLPIFIVLLAMGMTACRQHESAVVMQFLGLALLIVIPLILLI